MAYSTTTIPEPDPSPSKPSPAHTRLRMRGAATLSDAELLSVALGIAESTAAAILTRIGGVYKLAQAGHADLHGLRGLRSVNADRVQALFELGRRGSCQPTSPDTPVRSPRDVARILGPRYSNLTREHFLALALNARHRPIAELTIAIGGLAQCVFEPSDAFRPLLQLNAYAVIFAHNHPAGDPSPSPGDKAMTARLVDAGTLLGIRVLDHLIFAGDSFHSFCDSGEMPR